MGSRDDEFVGGDGGELSGLELPNMMFADGEEPVGVRVLTYQSSRAINTILNALHEDEIQYIRMSSFGKILDIADKPAFSGRFARFMLSRQLKTERKHETWFRFSGKPIRSSLREFAIVTGLPCGELPEKPKTKKKRTIKDKPYWPELFGKVEDLSVSRALKMLSKNSVKDKELRIKLACLAIVSSVLLSTNVKMKMLKEHAELLADIEEFFAYPWGRLAFEMLMSSIKKRDEISLSQNTITLQGFALALQLVIVEAVPTLSEIVQESCSSSESDSDDEDNVFMTHKTKKKTLSPAHAREVDKKAEVLVRSIIPQDPSRPVDESVLIWSDEVVDYKVENLLKLISLNYVFTKEMFRGGATKVDVERLREKLKLQSGKKLAPCKGKIATTSSALTSSALTSCEEEKIISIVRGVLKPDFERVDGAVAERRASIEAVSSSALSYKDNVVSSVEAMLKTFKEEFMAAVHNSNGLSAVGKEKQASPPATTSKLVKPGNLPGTVGDPNDEILSNVIANISDYSTPPGSPDRNHDYEARSRNRRSDLNSSPRKEDEDNGHPTISATSHTNEKKEELEFPSFDLGLTQENPVGVVFGDDEVGENGEGECSMPNEEHLMSRRGKRMKLVSAPLLNGNLCNTAILNRARESKMIGGNYHEMSVIEGKFARLLCVLKTPCVINVGGMRVTGKDIFDICERKRMLPGKVVDMLMWLVRSTYYNQVGCRGDITPEFLDVRIVSLLARNFERFKRTKARDSYVFAKGLSECAVNSCSSGNAATKFYLSFPVDKKHWIGLCVDFTTSKIYILDCNPAVRSDYLLSRDLLPISEMFPLLLQQCGLLGVQSINPLSIERIRGIAENTNLEDSAITVVLLIQTHAIFGAVTCVCITPDVFSFEAHRAAVMLYEFHAKL